MTSEAAIEIAKLRMLEMGISSFHIVSDVLVVGTPAERTAKQIKIKAYNELYILVNYEKYAGLTILSDGGGYFNSDDYTNNTRPEFTGEIKITQIPGSAWSIEQIFMGGTGTTVILHPLEFVRVIY